MATTAARARPSVAKSRRGAQPPSEFAFGIFALLFSIIIIHATFVSWIRPRGEEDTQIQQTRMRTEKDYVPVNTIFTRIKDVEQETEMIFFLWAALILGYKAFLVHGERKMLERELIHVPEGIKILPEDAKDYARQLEALPPQDQSKLVVRVLQRALERFSATRSIRDAAETSRGLCDAEAEHRDSSLGIVRFVAWSIPAIGFIGTVRHIGDALLQANKAVTGDITGVTSDLGIAFNATFIALVLTLLLMFLLHTLQELQERQVHDTDQWVDHHVIRHMQVR